MTEKSEALDLLIKAVNIPSVNGESNEVEYANFVADYLSDTGCQTQVYIFNQNRANVVSVLKGKSSEKCLVINGHLDTVPYGDLSAWNTAPDKATIIDDTLFGRGSCDMKGGFCSALYAFRQLALSGFVPENDIIFIGTGDEESFGAGASEILKTGYLDKATAMVIAEPTALDISITSKGALWLEIEVFGKSAHGAFPNEGINAIDIAQRLISKIQKHLYRYNHELLGSPTCSLTQIEGGVKTNMIPDYCKATLDIRTIPKIKHTTLLNFINRFIKSLVAINDGLTINVNILNNRMAIETLPEEKIISDIIDCVESVYGFKPNLLGTPYFTDASIFLTEKEIPVVLFGPGEPSQCHKANEHIDISEYLNAIDCFTALMKKY